MIGHSTLTLVTAESNLNILDPALYCSNSSFVSHMRPGSMHVGLPQTDEVKGYPRGDAD